MARPFPVDYLTPTGSTSAASTYYPHNKLDNDIHSRGRCGLATASSNMHCWIVLRSTKIYGQGSIVNVTSERNIPKANGKSVKAGDTSFSSLRLTPDSLPVRLKVSVTMTRRSRLAARLGRLWAKSHLCMTLITE